MPGELLTLADLVSLVQEKVVTHKRSDWPYLGLEQLASGSPRVLGRLPSSSSTSVNAVFQPGDILFGKLRPNLRKSVQVSFSGYCSTDILVFRPQPTTDGRFAANVFQQERVFEAAVSSAEGTKMPRTSWAKISGLSTFAPPLPEQRRIAEVLDTLDTVIERTEQVIAKLKAARTGLLHDLLTRGLDEQGQLRDPERHPEQFKETELGRVPREWGLMSVAETAAPTPGSTVIGPFGSNLVAADYRDAGTPVVFVRDIKEDGFTWKSDVYVDARKAKELRAHSIQPGDVVVTKMGDPPCLACVYPNWMPPSVMTADIIRVSVDLQSVDARWLALYINSGEVKRQVRWITGGVTRSKVTLKDFRQLTVAVPALAEQHRILDVVSGTMHKTQAEQTRLAKFQALKQGLMEDLLTGRVRVPVSEGAAS